MIYIIAAILIFGVLIAVHELGHFLAAKACGVRVNEFAIGMGPALLKKTKGDTQYSLRLLPIGGFCAMEGEEEDSDDPAALNNQGFWRKLLIFAAGALMNFLAGLIIILVLYAGVKAVNVPVIRGFAEGCPLESAAGLQEGDRILSIDGERIYTFSDVSLLLGRNKTGDFDLVIRRDGQKLRLENFHMERGEYLDQSGEKFTVGVPSMTGFGYVAAAAMFNQMDIMDNVTWVTYDGAPALYQAYLSGEIDFATFDDNFAAQYAAAGDSITVGVVMNDTRSQYFPDVAAAGEWGVEGLAANIGFKAAAVKKGTPAEVCEYLTEKINEAVLTDGYKQWCEENYFGVLTEDDIYTGAEITEMLVALRDLNREVLTAAGLL